MWVSLHVLHVSLVWLFAGGNRGAWCHDYHVMIITQAGCMDELEIENMQKKTQKSPTDIILFFAFFNLNHPYAHQGTQTSARFARKLHFPLWVCEILFEVLIRAMWATITPRWCLGCVLMLTSVTPRNKARGVFGFDPSSHVGKIGFPAVQVRAFVVLAPAPTECMTWRICLELQSFTANGYFWHGDHCSPCMCSTGSTFVFVLLSCRTVWQETALSDPSGVMHAYSPVCYWDDHAHCVTNMDPRTPAGDRPGPVLPSHARRGSTFRWPRVCIGMHCSFWHQLSADSVLQRLHGREFTDPLCTLAGEYKPALIHSKFFPALQGMYALTCKTTSFPSKQSARNLRTGGLGGRYRFTRMMINQQSWCVNFHLRLFAPWSGFQTKMSASSTSSAIYVSDDEKTIREKINKYAIRWAFCNWPRSYC